MTQNGYAGWGGISGQIHLLDPLTLAFDFAYGSVVWRQAERLRREGWFATALLEYHLDWGTPGAYAWYGSGDDGNPANGSERLPALDPDNSSNYSRFAFDGARYLERNALIANNLAGTWGVGLRLMNISLLSHLTHNCRINVISGTNSPVMGKKMSLAGLWANGSVLEAGLAGQNLSLGMPPLYMTSRDYALEFGFGSNYEIGDNFNLNFESGYIALWLDTVSSVWGARHSNGQAIPQTRDAWNVNVSLVYSF